MNKSKVVALGTLAGLTIGGIAGVLFAPEKGLKTRRQIQNIGDDYMVDLKSKLDEFRNSLAGKHKSIERDAEYLAERGKAKYDHYKKDAKNAASDFKHW